MGGGRGNRCVPNRLPAAPSSGGSASGAAGVDGCLGTPQSKRSQRQSPDRRPGPSVRRPPACSGDFVTSHIRDGAVTVRTASLEDAPRLAELSAALGYPVSGGVMAKRLEAVLARSSGVVLLAELASGLVI